MYVKNIVDTLPQHTRCHEIFTKDDYSYNCKDCSFGDSSCMCSKCFNVKDHEVFPTMVNKIVGTQLHAE